MGVALYRKYRSRTLSEIVGQEHITTTLDNALKSGKVSHAYLFTGPRGVGKTSIARILAHEVNDLPYSDESMHLDIIEIDAASNRGIDEIRDLREKVHNAPTSAKYKVYIIDEVHMLTKPAFNALLKTLEEPPAHVIFILATTESHKLPDTIISRCMRFTFKPIEQPKAIDHLRVIAKNESISISDDALALIAEHSDGSFRDSISLLDQTSSSADSIEAQDVLRMLGVPPAEAVNTLLEKAMHDSPHELLEQLSEFRRHGYQAAAIAKHTGAALRQRLLDDELPLDHQLATRMLHQLLGVPSAHDPDSLLEIILLGVNLESRTPAEPDSTKTQPKPVPKEKINTARSAPAESEEKTGPATKATAKTHDNNHSSSPKNTQSSQVSEGTPIVDVWPQVLTTVKQRHNTIYSILRMAQPALSDDGKLTLSFAYAFHQKKINEEKSRLLIREVLAELLHSPVTVVCVVEKTAKPPQISEAAHRSAGAPPARGDGIDNISNIFGGAEVLE